MMFRGGKESSSYRVVALEPIAAVWRKLRDTLFLRSMSETEFDLKCEHNWQVYSCESKVAILT